MAKAKTPTDQATQPANIQPGDAVSGADTATAGDATAQPPPQPKNHTLLMADLHQVWDDLEKTGHDAQAEFMHFINHRVTSKPIDELKAVDAKATADAESIKQAEGESDADWAKRNAEWQAQQEANAATKKKA